MSDQAYQQLDQAIEGNGVNALFDQLLQTLADQHDFAKYFEALLMRARYELDLNIFSVPNAHLLEPELRDQFEEKVIESCRQVGQLCIDNGQLAESFQYFQMIDDLDPLRQAIEKYQPTGDEQDEAIVEIAIGQAVHPVKGVKIVLAEMGLCQAITACEGALNQQISLKERQQCVAMLVQQLHRELMDRLIADIAEREGQPPRAAQVATMLQGRAWLFEDDNFHVDVSHLNSIARMARLLPKGPDLMLAIQLCDYGQHLSKNLQYPDAAPFEDVFRSGGLYLRALAGLELDKTLDYFKKRAEQARVEEVGLGPAEIYVGLLEHVGQLDEALAFATRFLNSNENAGGGLVNRLCQEAKQWDQMARLAKRRHDLLSYAAALILQQNQQPEPTSA